MSKLEWHRPTDQSFESGLDRGVIYFSDGEAVPWNGLANVKDSGESEVKDLYLDGIKYLSTVSPRDWSGSLTAYTYPSRFGEVLGISSIGDGLYVDSQAHEQFNLSYRTVVGTPNAGKKVHHKIHLIYKAVAALSEFENNTLDPSSMEPVAFEFELSAVPIVIPEKRPTAHIVIDTRELDSTTQSQLEGLLYGTDTEDPSFPTITELIDLLRYSDDVEVVDNGDGTWTASGSNANIQVDWNGRFNINNVDAEFLPDGEYLLTVTE